PGYAACRGPSTETWFDAGPGETGSAAAPLASSSRRAPSIPVSMEAARQYGDHCSAAAGTVQIRSVRKRVRYYQRRAAAPESTPEMEDWARHDTRAEPGS